jgi:hypothetical protein
MPSLDVKSAISIAKEFVAEVLAEESPSNIGLEEVEFDDRDNRWLVTIGFSRPWNSGPLGGFSGMPSRDYRVVTVDDALGAAIALKQRNLMPSDA